MSVIEEVKQKADIVEVLSRYGVKLEKAGRNFKALCPFHSEKHGSFFVFPEQQRWHCFGACATGGDVIAFVMKREGVQFGQALRMLADQAGVQLRAANNESDKDRHRLFELNALAAAYYHDLLQSTAGATPRKYLLERGVTPEAISQFQLGCSPDAWDSLLRQLLDRGYSNHDAIAAGLAVQKEGGGVYDRFRGRLMFPIRDAQGRTTGFGARSLDGSDPKYINSPQTPVFDKGNTLYGIDLAAEAIRRERLAVLVEGYMDVIVAYQSGFRNVVASMGTSLTERQAGTLKKLTRRLALALDADAAGAMATLKGIETVSKAVEKTGVPVPTAQGLIRYESAIDAELMIVVMPEGKDPDEIIKEDPAMWQTLVQGALPVVEYVLSTAVGHADLASLQGRRQLLDHVLPVVLDIKEPVKQAHYVQKLSQMTALDERALWDAMRQASRPARKKIVPLPPRQAQAKCHLSSPSEEYCLALVLQNPELKEHVADLREEYLQDSVGRELLARWLATANIDSLRECLDAELHDILDYLMKKELPPANPSQRQHLLADCVQRLRELWLRNMEVKKEALLAESRVEGPTVQVEKLREQGTDVPEQLCHLFHRHKGKGLSGPPQKS